MSAHRILRAKKLNLHDMMSFSTSKRPSIAVVMNEKTGVATVSMQNLPVNTLTLEFLQQADKTIDDLLMGNTRGIILTSGIQNICCAGLDIKEIYQPEASKLRNYLETMSKFIQKLYGCPLPTAMVVNGQAPAAACIIALACEYRVMVDGKYRIGLNEAALGLKITSTVFNLMKEAISSRQSMLALTSAKMFTVEEALKVGLIDEISEDQQDGLRRAEQYFKTFDKIDKSVGMEIRRTIKSAKLKQMQDNTDAEVQEMTAFIMDDGTQERFSAYVRALKNAKSKLI